MTLRAGTPVGELASAHVQALQFGVVLEWCAERTEQLFAEPTNDHQAFGRAMHRAAQAYMRRGTIETERRLSRETDLWEDQ